MLSKLEKKILQCKTVKIDGVQYEFKRCTPEDFLGKEGIPISRWQSEAEFIANKERSSGTTWGETKEIFKKVFIKAIISIDNQTDNLENLINVVLDNYFVSSNLYQEIVSHTLNIKKKTNFLNLFQK